MNSKKYKDTLYKMRYINDLRDMIVSSAELYADDPAFLVKDTHSDPYRPITFRTLKEDIDSLGTKLSALGLRDKKVALIGENSYEWVVSYFAVVNGTGVIVPLDKDLPAGEVTNLLNRSEADAVIFSGKQKKKIMEAMKNCSSAIIMINIDSGEEETGIYGWKSLLEDGRELVEKGDRSFIDAVIDREAMCSLLFTSGTTGRSKGVMLSHRNLSTNVYNMSKYVKICQNKTSWHRSFNTPYAPHIRAHMSYIYRTLPGNGGGHLRRTEIYTAEPQGVAGDGHGGGTYHIRIDAQENLETGRIVGIGRKTSQDAGSVQKDKAVQQSAAYEEDICEGASEYRKQR